MKRIWELIQTEMKTWLAPSLMVMAVGSLGVSDALAEELTEEWTAPARKAKVSNPVPVDPISLAAGRDLYVMACLPCHGAAGRGDGPAAASLERKPGDLSDGPRMRSQSDGELFWKIGTGRSPMPVFEESLSEEQIWQLVNFVRTLAPKTEMVAKSNTSKVAAQP